MVREDRKARERREAKVADKAYMEEVRWQHPELVEAELATFTDVRWEVIVISDDEEECGKEGHEEGGEKEEINLEEWRSVFPNDEDDDDGTGPGPALTSGGLTSKDWLNLTFGRYP
ncbi:hypothetical protein D1007_53597 [Hordeum vulgare]|nr:hypothetical protein D1007_53597 [Hordeum vulgare]